MWYPPSHGYFKLSAWGANGFRLIRWLTSAFALTADPRFRNGALLGVNNMNGANPLGASCGGRLLLAQHFHFCK